MRSSIRIGARVGLALGLCLLSGCLQPADFKGKKNRDFHVIGHRGAPLVEAENTIAAMEAAARLGANAVEVDLVVTEDRHVVLWHDLDPDGAVATARQSGFEGLAYVPAVPPSDSPARRPVDELTLETFESSYGYSRTVGGAPDPEAPIATLPEFLAWLSGEPAMVAVYFDVKVNDPLDAEHVAERLAAARDEDAALRRRTFFLLSPDEAIVIALRDASEGIEGLRAVRDFESDGALEGAEALGLTDVTTGLTLLRNETAFLDEVEALLEAREDERLDSVVVWTIDRRMQMGLLLYYGVDGIMTNEPGVLRDLWDRTL